MFILYGVVIKCLSYCSKKYLILQKKTRMKNTLTLLFSLLLIGTAVSCKKEGCTDEAANNYDAEAKKDNGACTYDPVMATLTTSIVSGIGVNSASCGGIISNTGSEDITVVGLCWSTSQAPTLDDEKTAHFYSNNNFSSNMGGLTENTTYYVRAYVTTDAGTAYGDEKSFTTLQIGIPTLTTNTVILQNTTTVYSGGNITDNGYGAITERGICWGTTSNPTINDSHTADVGTGLGTYTQSIQNLQSETTYYVRAYATNSAGTAYGQEEIYVNPHVSYIGELYEGGVVFYLNNTGEHGLVCSLDDLSSSAPWGCEVMTGATDNSIFAGEASTQLILDQCTTPGIAAVLCSNYSVNGYSDWFLPSIQEFSQLYNNSNDVNPILSSNGGTTIVLNSYWTSNESDINNAFEYLGGAVDVPKSNLNYVRAVRAF